MQTLWGHKSGWLLAILLVGAPTLAYAVNSTLGTSQAFKQLQDAASLGAGPVMDGSPASAAQQQAAPPPPSPIEDGDPPPPPPPTCCDVPPPPPPPPTDTDMSRPPPDMPPPPPPSPAE